MPKREADYFRYFSSAPEIRHWGLGLSAAGFTRVPSGAVYPAGTHPADHHFNWSRGRVLEALQVVLITNGRGWLETRDLGRKRIEAGTAFVLLPKVWHRYRPDPATGWEESWIEVQGPLVEKLLRNAVFSPAAAVRRVGVGGNIEAALEAVHSLARHAGPGFDAQLAAGAFGVLAAWEKSRQIPAVRSRMAGALAEAERYLAEHLGEPVNIEALARGLGVAYSHFRRAFKLHTGYAPWQYVIQLRLSRVRRLLAASEMTLDDAAARVGFSSAFHLSAAFKRAYEIAPDRWRRQFVAKVGWMTRS